MSKNIETNGIRKMLLNLLSGDYDKASTALEPVIKEKIKERYKLTAQNLLAKGDK